MLSVVANNHPVHEGSPGNEKNVQHQEAKRNPLAVSLNTKEDKRSNAASHGAKSQKESEAELAEIKENGWPKFSGKESANKQSSLRNVIFGGNVGIIFKVEKVSNGGGAHGNTPNDGHPMVSREKKKAKCISVAEFILVPFSDKIIVPVDALSPHEVRLAKWLPIDPEKACKKKRDVGSVVKTVIVVTHF